MKLYVILVFICALISASENFEYAECGNRPLVNEANGPRVVGAKFGEPTDWPWIVSIQEGIDGDYFHSCGGVVLNHLWVLTAAHCFKHRGDDLTFWRVVVGANPLSDPGTDAQIRTLKEIIQHEDYNPAIEYNDIALLRLNTSIFFDTNAQPACLPPKAAILSNVDNCYAVGWGVIQEGSTAPSNVFQETKVNLISVERCNRPSWYNGAVGEYNLCAGNEQEGIDSCHGDHGGALMCKRSKTKFYTLVGINSWGSSCSKKQSPQIYTSTQHYLDWIYGHIDKSKKIQKRAVEKNIWQKLAKMITNVGKKIGVF
ncbi:acrosin-like [Spea bombifrons]|uniref:acrosin-like n=1 Tax=Spea bombifrons TaxID=233779 RepID=UPI002349A15C|nr:acrosin-like [Spea bombifrons]